MDVYKHCVKSIPLCNHDSSCNLPTSRKKNLLVVVLQKVVLTVKSSLGLTGIETILEKKIVLVFKKKVVVVSTCHSFKVQKKKTQKNTFFYCGF